MALNNLINHYDKRAMMKASEELMEPTTFLSKTFFKATETFAVAEVDLDIFKGKRQTAAYVQSHQEGQNVNARGWKTKTFTPPETRPKFTILPKDLQKRMPQGTIYDNTGNLNSSIQEFVGRNIARLDGLITRGEEWQCQQALFDGIVKAYDPKGQLIATIDYGRDLTALNVTVSTKWDNAASDPLTDLKIQQRIVAKLSGFTPRLVLMGNLAADEYVKNTEVQATLNKDWSSRGQLAFDMREDGAIWHGTADGFDFWSYPEWIIDPADSTEKPIVPEKKVLLASDAEATRIYGGIATADIVTGALTIDAAVRMTDMWAQKDPASAILQVKSNPLMVTNHPDAYSVLTVLT